LNLTYDEALSNFAFNFNFRRYTGAEEVFQLELGGARHSYLRDHVVKGHVILAGAAAGAYTRPLLSST